MTKIVGIRFRNVGKIYYFDPKNYKMKIGDHVIVETARGVEFGRVVLGPKEVGEDEVVHPLKEVLRVATQADEDREKQNRLKEMHLKSARKNPRTWSGNETDRCGVYI